MSRSTLGLVLGGVLMLAVAGCAQQPSSEATPAVVESSDVENAEAQSPEAESKPVVTVSRSPT